MRWEKNYEEYDWSEALGMAARRLVNSEGPCEKEGDEYGNQFHEILSKYYAYSYTDVDFMRFEFVM